MTKSSPIQINGGDGQHQVLRFHGTIYLVRRDMVRISRSQQETRGQ